VDSPLDALRTFGDSDLDVLVLGNRVIRKAVKTHIATGVADKMRDSISRAQPPASTADARDRLYRLLPQLRDYDACKQRITPYFYRISEPSYRSDSVNTDRLGFRLTRIGTGSIDCDNWGEQPRRALLAGGSTAFGVGVTDDRCSVSALLSAATGAAFLNVGIVGATSTQEVRALQYYADVAETVVLLSGHNNLRAAITGSLDRAPFAPVVGDSIARFVESYSSADVTAALLGGRPARSKDQMQAVPPVELSDDLDRCAEVAAEAQSRDLALIRRLAGPKSKILFALQPFNRAAKAIADPREREAFELIHHALPVPVKMFDHLIPCIWSKYAERIRRACEV
jgi:hypothetical protein